MFLLVYASFTSSITWFIKPWFQVWWYLYSLAVLIGDIALKRLKSFLLNQIMQLCYQLCWCHWQLYNLSVLASLYKIKTIFYPLWVGLGTWYTQRASDWRPATSDKNRSAFPLATGDFRQKSKTGDFIPSDFSQSVCVSGVATGDQRFLGLNMRKMP